MNRDFKGIWIPREIWLNENLSIHAKILWAEIWSLHDRESGGCYASNEYLCNFLGVKITRLKEVMKELRDFNFLVDVFFNGRQRIIRAQMPETQYGGQQTAGLAASSMPENRPADSRNSGHPSLLLDISRDIREEKTLCSLSSPEVATSVAPAIEKIFPQRSFSKEVKEMADKMLKILMKHSPVYRPPQNMNAFYKAVQDLIEKDKQDPELMLRIFEWAVADNVLRGEFRGWQSVVVTNKRGKKNTNPIEIFTIFVTKIKADMDSRRERKFDPCSDEARMQAAMDYMNKGAL